MMLSPSFFKGFLTLLLALPTFFLSAQKADSLSGIPLIEYYLENDDLDRADSAVTAQVAYFKENNNFDSLAKYPYYVGWVKHVKGSTPIAIQYSEALINYLIKNTASDAELWEAYMEQAMLYELIGDPKKAYENNQKALAHALKVPSVTGEDIGKIESNLGIYAHRFGNLVLSKVHLRKALNSYLSYPKTSAANLFNSNNNMGTVMWFSSKADSALYYYHNALESLKKMEDTPHNKYYRRAMVLSNMSGLLDLQGKKTEALQMMRDVIKSLGDYLKSDISNSAKQKALEFKFQAIDNLAGAYKSLGDYTKTLNLLKYSYLQKQKHFDENNHEIFKSLILIGQAELALKNYQTANVYLDKGIEILNLTPNDNLYWNADAHSSKAQLYDELGEPKEAKVFYEKSQMFYEQALQGEYDNMYLDFLVNLSLFYAKTGNEDMAKETAAKGYNYILETQGDQTLLAFLQIINMAEVFYILEDYQESLKYSQRGISILNRARTKSDSFIDSVRIEFDKPYAILLKVKAEYELEKDKDQQFLEGLLMQLDSAVHILERHKSIFTSQEDLSMLIHNNKDVFDFAKKISLELYFKTKQERFLDRAMGLLESSLYNRIRSRLNTNDAIRFAKVPIAIFDKEKEIRSAMNEALNSNELKSYFSATSQWENYLIVLRNRYPQYYKMRFATIEVPGNNIQSSIPKETTVVRYFFVEKQLYALLMDKSKKQLYRLPYTVDSAYVKKLNDNLPKFAIISKIVPQLYKEIWEPFAADISTRKIIIIPDGDLFNLSFEMLTPDHPEAISDFATNGLLAKHVISYNYSLLLLKDDAEDVQFDAPFVAFAPGFFDEVKQKYQDKIEDSMGVDMAYMRLLPQPFTYDLIHRLQASFGGEAFVSERSTKNNFKSYAGKHRVVHIGTHAESNNLSPELSRLIFAKDFSQPNAEVENTLYAYEIYNSDMTSNLTILTACETGKPSFQAGEGMISLAHAFNYAGSESMLTSLWNIDEQSSAHIIEYFYEYLSAGHTKDEALKLAKLDYLKQAEGRTLSPQYWAGLIILGDPSPVYLEEQVSSWKLWAAGASLLLVIAVIVFQGRKYSLRS